MENIENSENLDEDGVVLEMGSTENIDDKTLEPNTRVYSSGCDHTESTLVSDTVAAKSGMELPNPRTNIQTEKNSQKVEAKGMENAHLSVEKSTATVEDEKESDESRSNEFASDANRRVSENGISLFVEVFGPSDEFEETNEDSSEENMERISDHQIGEIGNFSPGKVENLGPKVSENEENVPFNVDYVFSVGDLAWVRTKTQSWWPVQIIDPSQGSSFNGPKPDQKGFLLVKYLQSSYVIWCSLLKLRPFAENFICMASQGKARNFRSAVEKAVHEYGQRIKLQMTCPCALNENKAIKEEATILPIEKNELDKNFITQFEPANFLYKVRNLACEDSIPGKLELAAIQSPLSAFYRSLGHHQVPLNHLHDEIEDKYIGKMRKRSRFKNKFGEKEDHKVKSRCGQVLEENSSLPISDALSEKGFESRERRRSKYLSYPFIDLNKSAMNLPVSEEITINNGTVSKSGSNINSISGQPLVNSCKCKGLAKRLYTKRPLKLTYQPKASIKPADLISPLPDLLSKLRSAALDCAFPSEEIDFDSVDRFFYGFRRWAFQDKCEPDTERKLENGEKSNSEIVSQNSIGCKSLASKSNPVITPKGKRRTKKEMLMLKSGSGPKSSHTPGVFDVNGTSGSFVINFESSACTGPENISEPKGRKKRVKKIPDPPQAEIALPDLNGSCITQSTLVGNPQASCNMTIPVYKPVKARRKRKMGPSSDLSTAKIVPRSDDTDINYAVDSSFVKNVHGVHPCFTQNVVGINYEFAADQSNNEGNNDQFKSSSSEKDSWVMGLFASGSKSNLETKKRKRNEKTPISEEAESGSGLPDLNGNVQINPVKKRRRKNNGESLGTALVLTFAEGFPVPSREALTATFCGFGPLIESETRKVLEDSRSAQVVFKSTSDAVEALKGVEKSSPFGPVLVKCQLHHLTPVPLRPCGLKPCKLKANNKPKEDLAYVRKSLEMMTTVLEKSGDNLSPDMRAKLENDVKRLLKKVSTMVGSSSSC